MTDADNGVMPENRDGCKCDLYMRALERIVYGPFPTSEPMVTPDRQAQFDDAVARIALGVEPSPWYPPFKDIGRL